jgi:equilibrative nucleoside transporter 1/2/3
MLSIQGVIDVGEPWWTIAWDVPFAIMNGYSATVSMIYASNHEQLTSEQKEFAGFLVSFAINAGLLMAMGLTFAMPRPRPIPF